MGYCESITGTSANLGNLDHDNCEIVPISRLHPVYRKIVNCHLVMGIIIFTMFKPRSGVLALGLGSEDSELPVLTLSSPM